MNLSLVDRFDDLLQREKDAKLEDARKQCEVTKICRRKIHFKNFKCWSFLFLKRHRILIFILQKMKSEEARKRKERCMELKEQAAELRAQAKNVNGEDLSEEMLQKIKEYNEQLSEIEKENAKAKEAYNSALVDARPLSLIRLVLKYMK